jgi:hypothetical protein
MNNRVQKSQWRLGCTLLPVFRFQTLGYSTHSRRQVSIQFIYLLLRHPGFGTSAVDLVTDELDIIAICFTWYLAGWTSGVEIGLLGGEGFGEEVEVEDVFCILSFKGGVTTKLAWWDAGSREGVDTYHTQHYQKAFVSIWELCLLSTFSYSARNSLLRIYRINR